MISANRMCTRVLTFAGTALLCGATALAQSSPGGGSMPQSSQPTPMQTQPGMNPNGNMGNMGMNNGQTTPADKMFVKKALQGGMAEVELGQLAQQKSSNDDVKQFGQKMVDDHTKLNDQMKPIAQQIGVKVPDGPSTKDKAVMTKLQALNGDAFDKAYMKDMVKDHKTDKMEFSNEAQNGSNPQVKDAASQGEKVISEHLQMAQQIAQKTGAMGAKSSM